MSASLRFHPLEVDDPFDEAYKLRLPTSSSSWHGGRSERPSSSCASSFFSCKCLVVLFFILTSLVTLLLSITAVSISWRQSLANQNNTDTASSLVSKFVTIRRIAFGSCTARDARPQPIWNTIVDVQPDAWIWLGDMAYSDGPIVDCHQVPHSPQCNCTRSYLRYTPDQCFSGDLDHIQAKFEAQVNLAEYRAFVAFMCPGHEGPGVPDGSDPAICARPILGTYDDHDSGWNNGNERLPGKALVKGMFLDAIGSRDPRRRSSINGLETSYLLPLEGDQAMQVILLDERWSRDPLPCQMRRGWCDSVLNSSSKQDPNAVAFCSDFLRNDGSLGVGSCCSKDERLASWCQGLGSEVEDPVQRGLWPVACDPTNPEMWGMRQIAINQQGQLVLLDEDLFRHNQSSLWNPWLISPSPVCEVLGPRQRSWLMKELESSNVALRVIGSGSVLLGSLNFTGNSEGNCSGDDFSCYQPAMVNLLHTLSTSVDEGCVIVTTGDFHYSDIKVVLPGAHHLYSDLLKTKTLQRPIWQVMSSGMSDSTASSKDEPCMGTFREDLLGLRPLGRCAFFSRPSFATIDVDVSSQSATLKIIDGSTGKPAVSEDGTKLEVTISLSTCLPI